MSEFFKCLYFFENDQIYVIEIRRTNLAPDLDKSELNRWLLVDKDTLEITALTWLALNYNAHSQERFFKQGFLSFDSENAVFIHESSSEQKILEAGQIDALPGPLQVAIRSFFI